MVHSIAVCVAHPDDETVLAGGTLYYLASQGNRPHLFCATRGEGGELGEPPIGTRATIGSIREKELRCAADALGCASVHFMGYVDPTVGADDVLHPFRADFGTLVNQLQAAIRRTGADIILSHGSDGEYGHPAHLLMHRATRTAVENLGEGRVFYGMSATIPGMAQDFLWNPNDRADIVLDVRPWLDGKERAALCHKSQHALFKRRDKLATVREALRTVEGFKRHWPPDPNPQDHFIDLLTAAGGWSPS